MFGLFKDKPTPKKVEKQTRVAKERYSKPEFRREAMQRLLNWGTPESLRGVLKRFNVVVQSPNWDEEEKRWLKAQLIDMGEGVLPYLEEFLMNENNIVHVASCLREILSPDDYAQLMQKALSSRAPDDHRSVLAKQELVALVGQLHDQQARQEVVPYVRDHADDVQTTAIDVIQAQAIESGYDALQTMITEDIHAPRVLRRAAQAISELGLPVKSDAPIAPAVLEDFKVEHSKLVRIG